MTRIAFIGAGSVEFTRDLLGDILSFPELADTTIALHDIDEQRLAAGEAMAHGTNRTLGLGAGINHQAWILRFERDGENLYPLLDAALERDPDQRRRVRVEMYRRFGYFPTESSEHSAEYLPYFMHSDEAIEQFRIYVDDYI